MATIARSTHEWATERLSCYEVTPSQEVAEQECIVLMHGGGRGDSKEPSLPLAVDLAAQGYRVLGLDFTGSGESSGQWSELTLNRRRDQAASLIESRLPAHAPLILVGFSMSGQTAADLISRFDERVECLALCAPGIYSRTLRDVPFGDESFGDLVFHRPELWPDSPALDTLAAFRGRIVLVLPEHDEMVPPGMAALVEENLRANPRSATLVLDGAGHLLDQWLAEHPKDRKRVIKSLLSPPPATRP
ncbi:alpha/beta fold hydrolase [Kitasatospora sp. MAP5-34]|uniref:alpha/beta hydrolase n=1 Tax=Kitasatospora sp. MAP5-34 TaxID=3035102 RepID=UPI002476F0EB|nr:alpha/beta fold hydrolase [Kitasatospora sp. MAP5-34]MDH6580255.1 pimeloyl-ACP methyl ester carboxylesterase [Kitasatospora sp. MAP5-34]